MTMNLAAMLLLLGSNAVGSQAEASVSHGAGDFLRFEMLRYRDRIEVDGRHTRTMETRILLRTATAVQSAGQLISPYVDGLGEVEFERVTIEKPDGRRVDVSDAPVEDLNLFGVTDTSISADVRFRRLTVPGLEPGDRLSYRMVIRQKPLTKGLVSGEIKLMPALGDPVQEYELDLPRDSRLRVRLREGLPTSWEELPGPADRLIRRLSFIVEQPDLEAEEITKESIEAWGEPDVMFTSFASWEDVGAWWWEISRDRLKPDSQVRDEARDLAGAEGTPREKVEALHRFVGTRVRYLNVSFGLGRMQPRPAPQILENRYGDCKDKHALLAALAASLDIEVRPVLVSTARADLNDDAPGPHQFDHMISVVRLGPEPDEWLWLDATNPFGPPGHLNPSLRDKRALLIEASGEGRIVQTPVGPPFSPSTEVDVDGSLESDGTLKARVVWRFRSDEEVQLRAVYGVIPQEKLADTIEAGLALDWTSGQVSGVSISDPADTSSAFRIEFDVERPPASTSKTDRDLWVPLPKMGLPDGDSAEPLELEPDVYVATARIEVAEGLDARAPLSLSLDRPFARYESSYSVEGRTVTLKRELEVAASSLPEGEIPSYEAFHRAVQKDRKQKFSILGTFVGGEGRRAASLHADGMEAFKKKDYDRAAELFREAVEAGPQVDDGYRDLGRALSKLGRNEEALEAFGRQAEIDPFHEDAYAWRAYALERLNRWDESEEDLLKQIEVAPFKPWSYEKMGERRTFQGRFQEAADYYGRAASLEPGESERWVDLALARVLTDEADATRLALDRARALDSPDWLKLKAGMVYQAIGDVEPAAELAAAALPSVASRLAGLSSREYGERDIYWVKRLSDAWCLSGLGARSSDPGQAEKYLEAAWAVSFHPEAGWALGEMSEQEGRLSEALSYWRMASSIAPFRPGTAEERQARMDEVAQRLARDSGHEDLDGLPPEVVERSDRPASRAASGKELMDLRTIPVDGQALADLAEDVLLLVNAEGRVEHVKGVAPKSPQALERQLAESGAFQTPLVRPDDREFKIVQRGTLACTGGQACVIYLELPGQKRARSRNFGKIEIARAEPADGSTLAQGQRVELRVTVRYELTTAERGTVSLVVQDEGRQILLQNPPTVAIEKGSGEVELEAEFEVPSDTEKVQVFVPMTGAGRIGTSSVALVSYTVE